MEAVPEMFKNTSLRELTEMIYDNSVLTNQDRFMEFLDDYKINKKVQSKKRVTKSRKLREDGEKMLQDLALTEEDIENIFDILQEELPEL